MTTSTHIITREIPKGDWLAFFEDFNWKHRGWIVSLEETSGNVGTQQEAVRLPFVAIAADLKDQENRITVILGGKPDSDMNRLIDKPVRIWATSSDLEQYDAIEVESEGGRKTLLHFHFVSAQDSEHQLPKSKST